MYVLKMEDDFHTITIYHQKVYEKIKSEYEEGKHKLKIQTLYDFERTEQKYSWSPKYITGFYNQYHAKIFAATKRYEKDKHRMKHLSERGNEECPEFIQLKKKTDKTDKFFDGMFRRYPEYFL